MKQRELRSMVVSLVAAIALLTIACGGGQTDSPAQLAPTSLRLYVFDCGTLKADPARFRLKPEEVATTDLNCGILTLPALRT